ncbi:hypothetical protein [Pleionea sp. CnH1-48]|uniref:hypothetical protein n=1 Tax=Pleionea sp. CnH1-48 TaxID=2954494 RepID=UPI00209693D9|nr:hypothetical protein [Pleionea sp. CnH1-48]MCO7224376.1 hypothetical protein [Pleionea sp. CnH1-48]
MLQIKYFCLLGVATLLGTSTSVFSEEHERQLPAVSFSDTMIQNGRLKFSDPQELEQKIEQLKLLPEEKIKDSLRPVYQRGFHSIRPFYKDEDAHLVQKYELEKIKQLEYRNGQSIKATMDLDSDDNLIADDVFAAMLNSDHEIQVGNLVYKYTQHGIFSSELKQIPKLYEYIRDLNTQKALSQTSAQNSCLKTSEKSLEEITIADGITQYKKNSTCKDSSALKHELSLRLEQKTFMSNRDGGTCQVGDRICDNDDPVNGGGGGSGGGSGGSNDEYYDNLARIYLSSLDYCKPRDATIPLFGVSQICIKRFNSKHRVKTKFWNQDYKVYASIGISNLNQRRKLGIWWNRTTDELRLGINQVYFEYTLPTPDYSSLAPVTYVFKNKVYNRYGTYIGPFNFNGSGTVKFPFNTTNFDTIQIIVDLRVFGIGGDVNETIDANMVNSLFWTHLWSKAKEIARNNGAKNMKRVMLTAYTPNKAVINYVDRSYRKVRSKYIRKIFDSQGGIGLVFSDSSGKFKPGFKLLDMISYRKAKIDVYGLSRSGSTWLGNKIKFEE